MKSDFCKLDPNHIWRWFEMRLQSDFYRCVSVWTLWTLKPDSTLDTTNSDDVKSRVMKCWDSRRAPKIHDDEESSEEFGGEMMLLHLSCIRVWNPRHQRSYVVTDAYVVTTATHPDRLVMSGHKNPIWSLRTVVWKDLRNKSDLPAVRTKLFISGPRMDTYPIRGHAALIGTLRSEFRVICTAHAPSFSINAAATWTPS